MNHYLVSLGGGMLIGTAISLMLLLNGHVTGVSGIVRGSLSKLSPNSYWRIAFLAGLLIGGVMLQFTLPDSLASQRLPSASLLIISGLLVGYGTSLGGGCTSGHGICGMSRFSPRSIVATCVFMGFGILAATAFRLLIGAA